MAVTVAFYKAPGTIFDKLIRFWMRGPYAHNEMILQSNADGTFTIASSVPGTGVRIAENQSLPASDWDFVTLPDADVATVKAWFEQYDGAPYDYVGLFGFFLRPLSVLSMKKFFCSRAGLLSLGFSKCAVVDPNGMAEFLTYVAAIKPQ